MRVAVFTDNDFDKVNGVTTTLTALVAHAPADIAPRICTAASLATDAPSYLALRSIPVPVPFSRDIRIYFPKCRQYLRRVVADDVEVIHVTTPGPLGLTALWIAAKTGLPLVGSFHTDIAAYTRVLSRSPRLGKWMAEYLRWMYGRCQQILVPSEATRSSLVASGLCSACMAVWSPGVDTDLFSPNRRSWRLRERWRVSDDRPALLYVGRVSREKGLEVVPELLQRLHICGVPHRLIVAGDGPLRPWLAARCPDAVFMGLLGRDAVAEAFASADVFLFPSATDTAGNVVLEAQAAGLPVIVGARGGPRENIIEHQTGFVCDVAVSAWVVAAADLLRDPRARQTMARAARQYALTRHWDGALVPVYAAYRQAAVRSLPVASAAHHAA